MTLKTVLFSLIAFSIALFLSHMEVDAQNLEFCYEAEAGDLKVDKMIRLYTKCIQEGGLKHKNLAVAYNKRGNAYLKKGEVDTAHLDFNRALSSDPESFDAHNNRGNIYLAQGDYDRAIQDYDAAIDMNPTYAAAYYNRGNALKAMGEFDPAIWNYTRALSINPEYTFAYNNRGVAHKSKGEFDKAIWDYSKAIGLDPNHASAYNNRGAAYMDKGMYDRAAQDYEKALSIDSNLVDTHVNVAWMLATANNEAYRDGRKAIVHALRAIESENSSDTRDTLAAAYAEVGMFDKAIEEQQLAISKLGQDGPKEMKAKLQARLLLYQNGKPYRHVK